MSFNWNPKENIVENLSLLVSPFQKNNLDRQHRVKLHRPKENFHNLSTILKWSKILSNIYFFQLII